MGEFAVDRLFEGQSNLVICEVAGEITGVEIGFALILDRMYKGKLKPGDLDAYTPEQVREMERLCARRTAFMKALYETAGRISL